MDFRAYRFEVRELGDTGTFTGYASVFGNVDSYGTVVDKGAFKKTLKDNGNFLPLLWYHDPMVPVGAHSGEEDDHGLLISGALDLDVEPGQRVYSGMRKGYIDRLSIGFNVITEALKDGINHFKEIRLWESSLVTRNFAANDQALVTDVRAAAVGLRRVNDAMQRGAAEELQAAVAELRVALASVARPAARDEAERPSEILVALAEELADLRSLLITEGPSIDTPREEEPTPDAEPLVHSALLDELRQVGRQLETTRTR